MQNWTFQQTISPAETFAVEYRIKVGESYETRSDQVSFASTSEVVTEYTKLEYYDKDGKSQSQDVVANTISTTTTCVGAANPTRWKSKLEAGSPAFPGTVLTKRTETFNKYLLTQDGPVESEVTTYEYEPTIAFAGGLAIENYKNIDLGVGNVLVRKTIVEKVENKAADLSKQTTIVYQAWGATSAGKTIAATIMAALKRAGDAQRISGTYTLVGRMSALVCSGIEKTINIGRGTAPAQPTALDQQNDKLKGVQDTLNTNGGWLQTNPVGNPYNSQLTDLSFGSDGTNSTDKYDMQFAPDSYLRPSTDAGDNGTGLNYVYVSSQAAAYEYGKAVYTILSGMANGKSITTELRNLPSEPMGTLFLEAAGTVGRFRANGTTFAFDSQGLIAGCDAMLDGGAGLVTGATGTDWFPMMVPATNLPIVTPAANNSPALANTIAAPSGFDPMAPGSIWASFGTAGVEGDVYAVELDRPHAVAAATESITRESVSKSLTWLLEVPYSLTFITENLTSVAVSSGTLAAVTALVDLLAGGGAGVIAEPPASGSGGSGGTGALLAFTGGTSMAWGSKVAYGFTFTLSASKTIKGVGFYDENQNGLTGSYSIMLLENSTNTMMTTPFDDDWSQYVMTVPSGTTATLSGSWRRVDLTATGRLLDADVTYTLYCEPVNAANVDNLIKGVSGVTTLTDASFGQNYSWINSGGNYIASTTSGDGTAYFGPMIFFE